MKAFQILIAGSMLAVMAAGSASADPRITCDQRGKFFEYNVKTGTCVKSEPAWKWMGERTGGGGRDGSTGGRSNGGGRGAV